MSGGVLLDQFIKTSTLPLKGRAIADAISLGYPLTGGFFFPHRNGAFLLRRRRLYPTPTEDVEQRWIFCGGGTLAATQIRNFPGFAHEASMGFQYVVHVAHGNGYISDASEPYRVDFDSGGNLITPALPMWPLDVTAKPIAAGKFRVSWRYSPYGQGGFPTDFAVYAGATAATVDYNTPLGTVTYTGKAAYTFDTGAFSHGAEKVFAVRARNVTPVAELNTLTTTLERALLTPPSGATVQYTRTVDRVND